MTLNEKNSLIEIQKVININLFLKGLLCLIVVSIFAPFLTRRRSGGKTGYTILNEKGFSNLEIYFIILGVLFAFFLFAFIYSSIKQANWINSGQISTTTKPIIHAKKVLILGDYFYILKS